VRLKNSDNGVLLGHDWVPHWLTSGSWKKLTRNEKADVAEHPQVFDHAGLLASEPLGTAGLLSI